MAVFDKAATGDILVTPRCQLNKDLEAIKLYWVLKKKTRIIVRSKYLCDSTLLKYSAFAPPACKQ